ncbi:PD-(D/E)XK nuclease family protein [Patescibacteria group bacterium]
MEDIDTVNLVTVHSSKGLEFPVVFMINLTSGRFPTRNRSDVIEIPDELIKESLPSGNEHIQEERRLFYVGMTRAKKYLYMTMSKSYGGKRENKPSGYIMETGFELEKLLPSDDLVKKPDQKDLFGLESGFRDIKPIPKGFRPPFLSYSQIDTYKNCPLKYKYQYVLKIPTMPSHALSYGITIHDTLRDFHQKLLFSKNITLENLLETYKNNWQPLGYLNEEHRQHRYTEGKKLLENYYEKHKDEKIKPLELEKSFNLKINGIRFYGRIDRIDSLEDGVEIIDYKTGATKSQKDVDKDDQVAFYAIAAKEALNLNPKKLTYYFVDSGEKVSTSRTDAQLTEKKVEVQKVIENIEEGKFEPKPGMHCTWCDYKEICPFAFKK